MKKGDLVMLNPNDPEIERLSDWHKGPVKYMASRPTTKKEREDWRENISKEIANAREADEDTFHIAFDDAGESRLPPKSVSVPLPVDRIYIVERARCRVEMGWGRSTGGLAKILDTASGEIAYVKRDMLRVIKGKKDD